MATDREVGDLILRLAALYTAEGVGIWLLHEHKRLEKPPADLIAEGRFDEVATVLEQLETGAFT